MPDFKGFPSEGLRLLTELGAADKAWLEAHRATYTSMVVDPAKALSTRWVTSSTISHLRSKPAEPKPFAEDHPREGLLRHKGLQVRWILPTPEEITSPDFVPWCMTELMRTREVHRLLVENFG